MFEKVVAAPADPILGLTEAFRADSRSHKINLGVGIYKDETGATPILHCVKKAEQKLLTDEKTKNYLGIEGNIEYGRIVQQLLFGQHSALVASGLLMGLNNVLTAEGLFISGKSLVEAYPNISDLASMINTFASAAYAFLPILVGFSATKMFGGNPYLGAVMGMIMVSGDLLNAYSYGTAITEGTVPVWHIGALTIEKVGYQGTVLPVLAAAAILAFIEKKLHKVVPEYLDNLLTPALSVLVTAFLTFTVVGGVMRTAGDWITNGILWLHDTLGVVGGFIFGFIYAPLTMTGMHHSLLPVDIQLIAAGGSFLFAIAACNNVAQGGATLAAMFCAKDKKMKSIAVSSGISALLGITEPAMFGVNLKMKYPFYAAMFGSAVGCAYVTLTNVQNISPGAAGIIGFVCIKSGGMLNYMIGILISLVVGFAVTMALSKHSKFKEV